MDQAGKIDVEKLTQAVPLLAEVEEEALPELVANGKLYQLEKGSFVYRQGAACAGFYTLVAGSVDLRELDDAGAEILSRRIRSGESFGVIDFLRETNHRLDAVMISDGLVFRFDGASFRARLSQGCGNAVAIMSAASRALESQLQGGHERIAQIFESPEDSIGEFERRVRHITGEVTSL